MPRYDLEEVLSGGSAPLRNEPVQVRSTARLSALLDAAAQAIQEIGYERLTTAMVAERSGASIGTVYRYFPDRIAVLQSVSMRFITQFNVKVEEAVSSPKQATWVDAMDAVVTALVDSFRHVPGFRSLRFGDVIDLRPPQSESSGSAVLAVRLAGLLSSRFGLADDRDLKFRLEAAIDMADALLARAFRDDAKGDTRFIAEAHDVVRSYLVGFYGEPRTTP